MNLAFGIPISNHTLQSAAQLVASMAVGGDEFRYVVTPNLDHIVNLDSDATFQAAYQSASLIVADGWPVVLAGRLLGCDIPERVSGSDLVPATLSYANAMKLPLSVFILGGMGDVPERAAKRILTDYPHLKVAGYLSPPLGFERDPTECAAVCDHIRSSGANFIVVGLGSPKQEKWIYAVRGRMDFGVAVCAGATVDFLAGSVARAPLMVQKLGLEWLYRVLKEPKRLAGRYARGMILFPLIFLRELSKRRTMPVS